MIRNANKAKLLDELEYAQREFTKNGQVLKGRYIVRKILEYMKTNHHMVQVYTINDLQRL